MTETLIKNARIINEGKITEGDVLIRDGRIDKIGQGLSSRNGNIVDAKNNFLFPDFTRKSGLHSFIFADCPVGNFRLQICYFRFKRNPNLKSKI